MIVNKLFLLSILFLMFVIDTAHSGEQCKIIVSNSDGNRYNVERIDKNRLCTRIAMNSSGILISQETYDQVLLEYEKDSKAGIAAVIIIYLFYL